MIDYRELSQPEHNSKENGALFLRDEIIPTIHRFSSTIKIQIHAFRQLLDGLITALVILKLPPEDSLQSYAESIPDLYHNIHVYFFFHAIIKQSVLNLLQLDLLTHISWPYNILLEFIDPR